VPIKRKRNTNYDIIDKKSGDLMKLETTLELEQAIRYFFQIPYVNLKGIDFNICQALFTSFQEIFAKYPLLQGSLCSIGPKEDIERHLNLLYSYSEDQITLDVSRDVLLGCIYSGNEEKCLYTALILGNPLHDVPLKTINEHIAYETLNHFHPEHVTTLRECLWHEIGHLIDFILNISSKQTFLDLLETIPIAEISRYATRNEQEALAEAFAEYHATKKPTKAVYQIASYVLKEYQKEEARNSKIFAISKAYK